VIACGQILELKKMAAAQRGRRGRHRRSFGTTRCNLLYTMLYIGIGRHSRGIASILAKSSKSVRFRSRFTGGDKFAKRSRRAAFFKGAASKNGTGERQQTTRTTLLALYISRPNTARTKGERRNRCQWAASSTGSSAPSPSGGRGRWLAVYCACWHCRLYEVDDKIICRAFGST